MTEKRQKRIWKDKPQLEQKQQLNNLKIKNINYSNKNTIQKYISTEQDKDKIKVVLLGDGGSGKTSLLISYCTDKFDSEYTPTIFDLHQIKVKKDNEIHTLQIWDTAGQEQYKKLRTLSYSRADIFLICFSLIQVKQFKNATKKWYKQIQQKNPSALVMFVGTKVDLINEVDKKDMLNTEMQVLDKETITKKIKIIGCPMQVCSSVTQDGLSKIFDKAIEMVINKRSIKPQPIKKPDQECQII